MRLALASAFTLGLLASFLFAILGGLAVFYDAFSFYVILGLVVGFNVLMWLISPKISDITYSWFYDMSWIDLEELREISPESAKVIEEVTEEYDYKTPKLGIIHDSNPQAFTYGSDRWNARIMVTEGLFEYLDDNEAASVYAHELGHVTNRDFIIMTIANTIVQLLYLIAIRMYRMAVRSNDGRRGAALAGFAVISYIFYILGRYLVYYLSRVREYYADKFAGKHTDPDYLSSALIKISYGIMDSPDNKDLMNATESMGIMDVKQGEEKGAVYYNASNLENWDPLAKAFLFDLKNPWASLLELKSSHPLTGKRVKALSSQSSNPMFDFEKIKQKFEIDTRRLYKQLFQDLAVVGLPGLLLLLIPLGYLLGLAYDILPEMHLAALGLWVTVLGGGKLGKTLYKYPLNGEASETSVIDLLADIYASPVRGAKAQLDGRIIGKGNAGYKFGSDLKFKDDTGIMHLRYQSIIPIIGNFLFGWRKAGNLVDQSAKVKGWFFRGTMPWISLREVNDENSWPHIHSLIIGAVILVIGLLILAAGLL